MQVSIVKLGQGETGLRLKELKCSWLYMHCRKDFERRRSNIPDRTNYSPLYCAYKCVLTSYVVWVRTHRGSPLLRAG